MVEGRREVEEKRRWKEEEVGMGKRTEEKTKQQG